MIFETKSYDFKFNIRNKQGGIYPDKLQSGYKMEKLETISFK